MDIYQRINFVRLHKAGKDVYCPICGTKLIVAINKEETDSLNVMPGIYCPISLIHVCDFLPGAKAVDQFRDLLRRIDDDQSN
jgi:hypothetical protein